MTMPKTLAIVGWVVAMSCTIGAIVVRIAAPAPFLPVTFGFGPMAMLAFLVMAMSWASVGAYLAIKRRENLIGRLMVISGSGYALSMLALTLTFAFAADGTSTGRAMAEVAGSVTVLGTQFGAFAFVVGFIFPTGRGQSPSWARVLRLSVPVMIVFSAAILLQPGSSHLFPTLQNPFGVGPDLRFGQPVSPLIALFGVILSPLVAISLVTRYRAAAHVERQQLKWFSMAVTVAFVGVGGSAWAAVMTKGSPGEVGLIVYGFGQAGVPVAIGIAILRHNLYDIDRIISRTIAYALVSTIVATVFGGIIVLLSAALAGFTQGQTLAVAASTLVAFALFQPLRRRVQWAVDRRFDRARYDAQRTVDVFAEQLRNEVDLARLRAALVATAEDAVRPVRATVWLRAGSGAGR